MRRDQAKAAADEQEQQRKKALAVSPIVHVFHPSSAISNTHNFTTQEQEVRLAVLRNRANVSTSVTASDIVDDATNDATTTASSSSTGDHHKPWHNEHINLFADLDGTAKPNSEHQAEKKAEQEKYEKQIGYLTYLGQDTNESLGRRDWYDRAPHRPDPHARQRDPEVGLRTKLEQDPLNLIRLHTAKRGIDVERLQSQRLASATGDDVPAGLVAVVASTSAPVMTAEVQKSTKSHRSDRKAKKDKDKHKHKKSHKSSDHQHKKSRHRDRDRERTSKKADQTARKQLEKQLKLDKLQRLRGERLERERREQQRADALLAPKVDPNATTSKRPPPASADGELQAPPVANCKQKYNSQFNPYLAKQNYD